MFISLVAAWPLTSRDDKIGQLAHGAPNYLTDWRTDRTCRGGECGLFLRPGITFLGGNALPVVCPSKNPNFRPHSIMQWDCSNISTVTENKNKVAWLFQCLTFTFNFLFEFQSFATFGAMQTNKWKVAVWWLKCWKKAGSVNWPRSTCPSASDAIYWGFGGYALVATQFT